MGVFRDTKATLLIWIGFIVYGAFELIFACLRLHWVDKMVWSSAWGSTPDFYNIIYVGFFFAGATKIVCFLPKLNNSKLLAFIALIIHAAAVFFGIVGMAGLSNEYPGFENGRDKEKAYILNDGILLFGTEIGFTLFFLGLFCNIKKSA